VTRPRISGAPQVADQEGQQVPGGLVGPVHVLHDQHQRALARELLEQGEQHLEQPPAGRLGVGVGGRGAGNLPGPLSVV
jgi:predicted N-acetyltransferase YhbS